MSDPDDENGAGEGQDDEHETEWEAERLTTREEGAALLRRLADGVAAGTVELGDDGVVAEVPDRFELELEFERDDEEAEIEVELEWPVAAGESIAVEPGADDATDQESGDEEATDSESTSDEATSQPAGDEESAESGDESQASEEASTDPEGSEPGSDADATEADGSGVGESDLAESPGAAAAVEDLIASGDATESKARFELFRDRANEWRWRLVHDNGNVIADSGEGYARRAGARNGLESVVRNAPGAAVVEDESAG